MENKNKGDNIIHSATLYISHFQFEDITIDYTEKPRISITDLEMDYDEARKLIQYLTERIDNEIPGAIRIRVYGQLVVL